LSDPILVEVMTIFASTGVILLALAGWLLKRRAREEANVPIVGPPTIWTPKVIALTIVGAAVTLLFLGGVTGILRHQFSVAILMLLAGSILTVAFFRRRKIALAVIMPCVLLAMAEPMDSKLARSITVGSAGALLILIIWIAKRYPHMKRGDFRRLFDTEP
jgi:hypothetical protein